MGSRSTTAHLQESVEVFRIGRREVNANPDGIEFMGPMFEAMRAPACSRGRPRPTRPHRLEQGLAGRLSPT
jgi:hypothetical protein